MVWSAEHFFLSALKGQAVVHAKKIDDEKNTKKGRKKYVLACGTKVRSSGTRETKKNGTKVEEKSREEKKTETKKWLHVIRFCLYVMLHINNSKDEAKGFQGKKSNAFPMKISMEHKLNISDKDYSLMDVNVFLPLDRNTFLLIISICQMIENTANKFPN